MCLHGKRRLRKRLLELRLAHVQGQLRKQDWLAAVVERVRTLEDIGHAHSFARLGMDGQQQNLKLVKDEVMAQDAVAGNP